MYRVSMMKPGTWRAARHIGCRLSTSSKLAGSFHEQPPAATSEYSAMRSTSDFARRHIGPTDAQTSAMLEYLELEVTSLLLYVSIISRVLFCIVLPFAIDTSLHATVFFLHSLCSQSGFYL